MMHEPKAATDLQSGKERIIDIAVKYGYDSADSFAIAFAALKQKNAGNKPTLSFAC